MDDLGKILTEDFGVDVQALKDHNTLSGDLGLDSLEVVQFSQQLEDVFGVEIQDYDITGNTTLGEVHELLRKQTGA